MIPIYVLFGAASLVFIARIFAGPFHWVLPVNSPLNAEGLIALSFLLAFVMRPARPHELAPQRVSPFVLCGAAVFVAAAFLPGVTAPLVHDSYIHLGYAATETWSQMMHRAFVGSSTQNGPFFRPSGYVTYWIDYRWARNSPALWHLWNLAMHLVNCALVWLLARRLGMPAWPATVAALIFALHGTRPEVVSWAAARFDLLATFFTLLTLLAADRLASLWVVAGCTAFALLSKEAAFCLPLLVLLLIPFRRDRDRRRLLQAAGTVAVVCVVFFVYRTWYLGGIGGYRTPTGEPSIFQFSMIRSAKALFFREWAVLFFPINWSADLGLALKAATVLMIGTAAGFLWSTRGERRPLLLSLAFVVVAVLPAQHLLLIGADLSGARVLYLPTVGLALFWGFSVDGSRSVARIALPVGLLVFQVAALEHNLRIWREVAFRSQLICRNFGSELTHDFRYVVVRNLPATQSGVFFLRNGFPTCVEINSGQPANRIYTDSGPAGARTFTWSDKTQTLEEVF